MTGPPLVQTHLQSSITTSFCLPGCTSHLLNNLNKQSKHAFFCSKSIPKYLGSKKLAFDLWKVTLLHLSLFQQQTTKQMGVGHFRHIHLHIASTFLTSHIFWATICNDTISFLASYRNGSKQKSLKCFWLFMMVRLVPRITFGDW